MKTSEIKQKIKSINSKSDLRVLMQYLKILASNNRSSKEVILILEESIVKSKQISDKESLAILYGLLILQLEHDTRNLNQVEKILENMQSICLVIDYKEGLAFSYSFSWYIERMKGNRALSKEHIEKAILLLNEVNQADEFIYYFINYSYAIQSWTEKRNPQTANIFENCFNYFYENNLYHSTVMSLGILMIIYQQTQDKEKSMKLIKKILGKRDYLSEIPEEIRSNIHFIIGFSHELSFNLEKAEEHLLEAKKMLESIYKTSIYSSYYLTALSYLTATYALQGKFELAVRQMREVDELIEEGIATKNLDNFSKEQMKHIFNLTKFYIHSRLQNFCIEDVQELLQTIFTNISKYYSNAIFFGEFLLNAELTKEQLVEIRDLNNPSTRRVEHIINFLIEKTTHTEEKQIMNLISTLKKRPMEEKMTFVEKAFADLLAAQEYYKINRFAEIYPLLKKYEKQLHFIEVLELRIFMEAFIQVGAFKSGDPLGPALQYMAIKKCRNYGFSRLENKLLDYLDMQHRDVQTLNFYK